MRSVLLSASGLLLALPLMAGCAAEVPDESGAPSVRVGDVVVHRLGARIEGQHAYVVVPGRRYDFLVSTRRDELDRVSAETAGVAQVPARDAAVVEVGWTSSPADGDWAAAVADDAPSAEVVLVVDGERHVVGDLEGETPHAAYVVVAAGTSDVDLEVTYDGLVQTVEAVGGDPVDQPIDAPAGLYGEVPRLTAWDKASGLPAGVRGLGGGNVSTRALSPTPYVSGLGWAPDGRSWLLVDVAANGVSATGPGRAGVVVDGAEVDVQLDEQQPARLLPLGSPHAQRESVGEEVAGATGAADVWRAQAVFLVPDGFRAGELTVRRPLDVRPGRGADVALAYDRRLVF